MDQDKTGAFQKRVFRLGWVGLPATIALTLPAFLPSYHLYILSLAGVWAVAAIGLNLLTGYAGQISIGHAGFVGIGAYVSALLTLKAGLPFWLALPAAGLVSAVIGLGLGLPALRLSGLRLVETSDRWQKQPGALPSSSEFL